MACHRQHRVMGPGGRGGMGGPPGGRSGLRAAPAVRAGRALHPAVPRPSLLAGRRPRVSRIGTSPDRGLTRRLNTLGEQADTP